MEAEDGQAIAGGADLDAALLIRFRALPECRKHTVLCLAEGLARTAGTRKRRRKNLGGDNLYYPNIEAERARMGRTKKDIAAYLGVNVRSLQNWQAGKSAIPASKLCKLCDLFDCSADYLLGRSEERGGRSA